MQQSTQQFEFHGKTGEFFKIWIVNIMLSIVTLGIYSAWAKVRTRQYFYNNTLLMNTPFDYLADPVKIFPWVIIKALKFNLYNSAYRHIRFHFDAQYLRALWVFLGLPILVALSVGLAYPYFIKVQKQFVIDHCSYGTSAFKMEAKTSSFYGVFLKMIGIFILVGLLIGGLVAGIGAYEKMLSNPADLAGVSVFIIMLFFPLYMVAIGYWYANLTNLIINNTSLQQCQLESHLKTSTICWIYFSNTLAIICSLGSLIPWAMIRTRRYRI
jgi:uncharacterized membrane protein YjgN (DUF898 family)